LAQAVMILCYEIFLAARETRPEFAPRLASVHDLEGMYAQLKEVLLKVGFIKPDNPEYWLNNLRQFFARLPLRAREVKIVRGMCRQVEWYAEKRFADGRRERAGDPSPPSTGQQNPGS
jgi:tRNA/rRNA methyltransferase